MNLDEEIRAVEVRIARERNGLALLAQGWASTARDVVVSKKSLFAVAALGFVLGDALRPAKPAGRARKLGLGGMLAGIALSALRSRYGSPWALAELAWEGWRGMSSRRDPHVAHAALPLHPAGVPPRPGGHPR